MARAAHSALQRWAAEASARSSSAALQRDSWARPAGDARPVARLGARAGAAPRPQPWRCACTGASPPLVRPPPPPFPSPHPHTPAFYPTYVFVSSFSFCDASGWPVATRAPPRRVLDRRGRLTGQPNPGAAPHRTVAYVRPALTPFRLFPRTLSSRSPQVGDTSSRPDAARELPHRILDRG